MTYTNTTSAEMNRYVRTIIALAMVAALFITTSGPSRTSTTFTVNIPGDVRDANTGDDRCDVNPFGTGDQCSLRAAIEQANRTPGADAQRHQATVFLEPVA